MSSTHIKWYIFAVVCSIFFTAYYLFALVEKKQLNELNALSIDVRTTLEKRLKNNLDYIKLLGEMRTRNELTPDSFNLRTKDFLAAHEELINFTWVDSGLYIRGVSPISGNEQILGLHLDLPEPARVSELAQQTRTAKYTEAFEAIQGGCSFEVWHPVFKGDEFLGLFAGVYSCEKLLKSVLVDSTTDHYLVSLTDNKNSFLAEINTSQGTLTDHNATIMLNIDNNLLLSINRMRLPFADFNLYILAFIVLVLIILAITNGVKIRTNIKNRLILLEDLEKANSLLKESEKRFKLIFQSSPIGMILLDERSMISGVNPYICELFAYDETQLLGQSMDMLIPRNSQQSISWAVNDQEKNLRNNAIAMLDSLEGSSSHDDKIPLQLALAPLNLNGQPHTLVSILDNTERKKLFDEIQVQNEKLQISNKKLVQTNDQLERFAYICSHDLQEPVRMVQSFGPMLEQRLSENPQVMLDQKSSEYLSYMIGGANRARDMIDDILKYCRDDQPVTNFEQVSLVDICSEVNDTLAQQMLKNNGSLKWQSDLPVIMAVSSQVFQLILNLVNNGLKFNRNEHPLVEVTAGKIEDEWKIEITDNGIGIDEKYQQQIFNIFERLHGNSEYPGTGIGLASCLKIAERHNARIEIISELDKGSTFCIYWPRSNSGAVK
jgi:PAS domain S-box-containing protein